MSKGKPGVESGDFSDGHFVVGRCHQLAAKLYRKDPYGMGAHGARRYLNTPMLPFISWLPVNIYVVHGIEWSVLF